MACKQQATEKYHRLALAVGDPQRPFDDHQPISVKDLANRFMATQQANWRNPCVTLRCYKDWLGRFISDHPRLNAVDFTVEMFAAWKLSLRQRGYSPVSIKHFLKSVRTIYNFGEEAGLIENAPRPKRIKNDPARSASRPERLLYSVSQLGKLLNTADTQLKLMLLLGLNYGFGPKDVEDLVWDHVKDVRATLPRSKTGVCQTFLLWPETLRAFDDLQTRNSQMTPFTLACNLGQPFENKGI